MPRVSAVAVSLTFLIATKAHILQQKKGDEDI